MTNYEKFKDMCIEDMADFLCSQMYCQDCPFLEECNGYNIEHGWLGFLKKDYEGELLD